MTSRAGALGASGGISSRGDAARYGADIAWGTDFAGGRGHFMVAGEYMKDQGIAQPQRAVRNLEAGLFERADRRPRYWCSDPNSTQVYNGGSILNGLTGAPHGLVFNRRRRFVVPFPLGSVTNRR